MALMVETSNPSAESMVRLRSSDDEVFTIKKEVAMKSKTIADWVVKRKDPDDVFPVHDVKSSILQMVIEYCEQHVDDVMEDMDFILHPEVTRRDPFGDRLRRLDRKVLFELIKAANYLKAGGLLHLGCQIVADMMKDKSVEEMREILHTKNDYTPEEEAAARKKFQWAFDN